MIVVDTSALMAILQDEPTAEICISILSSSDPVMISAGTLTEALIVSTGRGVGDRMKWLVERFGFQVVPVTADAALRAANAHAQWGKGNHPAGLNFGDCFAYALAKERGCPLLFVGADFSQTDVKPALA